MLTVVGWLWKSERCLAKYSPRHASVWARMIHANLSMPHRIVLMTDQPGAKYDPLIEPVPLWSDWRGLINRRWGTQKPTCYVRLKAFSEEARKILGDRFVSIDLDCLVMGPLDPLFDRPEDFLIYRRPQVTQRDELNPYQGSMWMMTAGARAQVWTDFRGEESINAASQYLGTDQAWIRHRLGPDEAGWTQEDGVFGWPRVVMRPEYRGKPPAEARIVFFYGTAKPWDFGSGPRCDHCGELITVRPPYVINRPHRVTHPWLGKIYARYDTG